MAGFDLQSVMDGARGFLDTGGAAMWAIGVLSVITLALILWKTLALWWMGAFGGGARTAQSLALWRAGDRAGAQAVIAHRRSARAQLLRAAMQASENPAFGQAEAEAETTRVARGLLAQAGAGLRGIELAATIGPLLGLFGTVTGMIAAFQALQEAGSRADPATLAGGIWEALLTTAAGMAVAIPAQIALAWFEGVVDRMRHDMQDAATQVFVTRQRGPADPARPAGGTVPGDEGRHV